MYVIFYTFSLPQGEDLLISAASGASRELFFPDFLGLMVLPTKFLLTMNVPLHDMTKQVYLKGL